MGAPRAWSRILDPCPGSAPLPRLFLMPLRRPQTGGSLLERPEALALGRGQRGGETQSPFASWILLIPFLASSFLPSLPLRL